MSKSVLKDIKQNGKHTFDGPEVKQRKNFAPATKKFMPKGKGKGSYDRKSKSNDEDEEGLGGVPLKKGKKSITTHRRIKFDDDEGENPSVPVKGEPDKKRKPLEGKRTKDRPSWDSKKFEESTDISKFIDCIFSKNYSVADKYIKQAVETKIQSRIEKELTKNLF